MMWDKKEFDKDRPVTPGAPPRVDPPIAAAPPAPSAATHPPPGTRGRTANIGSSLFIKGEVTGSEDLTVEGRVEGRIDLKDHNLTIAQSGKVQAEIHAKSVLIVGEVSGNVLADEKVEIADTGKLFGDINAPRVAISDGAHFRGSVDMSRERAAVPAVTALKERIQATAQPQVQRGAAG